MWELCCVLQRGGFWREWPDSNCQQLTSDSCDQGRIFQGGAAPAICTLSPRQLAEGQLAQDGAVSCRTRAPPPVGDWSELEVQEWDLVRDKNEVFFSFIHIYNCRSKQEG